MVNVIEVQGLIDAIKDITGVKGDTGATPDITITATADALSSENPSVTVTKTGTTEEPSFALAFSGLKGAPGTDGTNGGRYGGTTVEGTVVDDLITFAATDVSNADNLRAGDVIIQIYNGESYLYVVDSVSGLYVYGDYSTRVKLAESGGLPSYTSSNRNNILKVNDSGTDVEWVDDYNGYHNASYNQNFSYPQSRTLKSWGDGDTIPKYNHVVYAKKLQFYDATNDAWTTIESVDLTRFTYFEWSGSGITLYCKIAQQSVIIDYFKSLGLLNNSNTYSILSETGHKGELYIFW